MRRTAHDARWQPGNYEANQALVRGLGAIAEWEGCTVAQVALGGLLGRGAWPNVAAVHLTFTSMA
jgi:aryl-alcohol dehydrogenase-like predicted oxidoreductase